MEITLHKKMLLETNLKLMKVIHIMKFIKKTINNIRNLNFFRKVKSDITTDENDKTKIINITVEEKATGEIFSGQELVPAQEKQVPIKRK